MNTAKNKIIYENKHAGVAVYKQTSEINSTSIVIKRTQIKHWDQMLQREIPFIDDLRQYPWHENLTKCYKIDIQENHVDAFYEAMDRSLTKALQSSQLSTNQYKHTAQEITRGLRFLHQRGYLHRDLKPDNILVSNDWQKVKICDYGFIIPIIEAKNSSEVCGTPSYMTPEIARAVLKKKKEPLTYTIEMDMYSLARTLQYMLYRREPFSNVPAPLSNRDLVKKIIKPLATPDPIPDEDDVPFGTPQNIATIIYLCLSKNPNNRPKTEHLLYLMAIPDTPILSTKGIELHSRKKPQTELIYPNQRVPLKNEATLPTSPLKSMSGRYRFWSECNTRKTPAAEPTSNNNIFWELLNDCFRF